MKESIATKAFTEKLLTELTNSLSNPQLANNKKWTSAVWHSLHKFARTQGWELFPKKGPYKGEYLVDFIIFEEGYGPRVAVECEWFDSRRGKHIDSIDWAFDKLRGVKADVKLLIYEWRVPPNKKGPDPKIQDVITKYIADYELLTPKEAFAFLQYIGNQAHGYWWQPLHEGKHKKNEIKFELLDIKTNND